MIKKIIGWVIVIIVLFFVFWASWSRGFWVSDDDTIIIETFVGDTIIIEPEPIILLDTVYIDSVTVKIVNRQNPVNVDLLRKYNDAIADKDTAKQTEMFSDAVTQRQYIENYEDSVITITVNSYVTGSLTKQRISYETKEREVQVPKNVTKSHVYVGAFTYALFDKAAVGIEADYVHKSQKFIYSVGYDTEKRVHLGVKYKIY